VGAEPGTNTGKGGRRKKNTAEPPAGYIPVETLRQVKDATGLKDEILAEMLGISRPTLANIMKGKGWCVPNNERRNAILNTLATHAKALNEAYKVIGG
jgi:transcriptional regulator with XRE-family HTH domain